MIILNVLQRIFNILFLMSIIISVFVGTKEIFTKLSQESDEKNSSNNESDESSWRENIHTAIMLTSVLVLICGIVFIVVNQKELYWVLFLIGVPMYLERIIGTYQSFGIVETVVKSSDNEKLSFKEQTAIKTLAYVLWFLGMYHIFEKIIECVALYTNTFLSDLLLALIYVVVFYLYIFFIFSLLPELLFLVIKILKKVYVLMPWKTKINKCGDFWINKIEKPIESKSILIAQWEIIGKWKSFIRWIRYLLLPIAYILDIVVIIVKVVVSFINSTIGYLFILERMIKKTLNRISIWLLSLSDKRIVAISFRIALVMALLCVVVLNQYQTIFKIEDASTAVLEFVASAIIIPIVFEWISTVKNYSLGNQK